MGFPITVSAPTTILTRRAAARELLGTGERPPVLIIELDEIDQNGTTYTRSALVARITDSMVRGATPEETIRVEFAHPEIEPRVYNPDDEVTVHYLTFEHLA